MKKLLMLLARERKINVVEWKHEGSATWHALSGHMTRSAAWRELKKQRTGWAAIEKKSNFRTTLYLPKKEATND